MDVPLMLQQIGDEDLLQAAGDPGSIRLELPTGARGEVTLPASE